MITVENRKYQSEERIRARVEQLKELVPVWKDYKELRQTEESKFNSVLAIVLASDDWPDGMTAKEYVTKVLPLYKERYTPENNFDFQECCIQLYLPNGIMSYQDVSQYLEYRTQIEWIENFLSSGEYDGEKELAALEKFLVCLS